MRRRSSARFARATEMGSISPAAPVSVYPSFIVTQAWQTPVARFLWVSGLILNIGLIVWVGILIPSLSQIPFGFDAFGAPNDPTASSRLILLPLLSMLLFIGGVIAGLYYYRWDKNASAGSDRLGIERDQRVVVFDGGVVFGNDACMIRSQVQGQRSKVMYATFDL
jgi:hypothetical protein